MTAAAATRARAREKLADVELANDLRRPVGAFALELRDPRTGKLVDRRRQGNYITPVYERLVRWFQGAQFHAGVPFVSDSAVNAQFIGTAQNFAMPPLYPIEAMVGLDSAIPSDPASDWLTGRTVGYGFRWKATGIAAAGKRGQINEAQCLLTPDTVRLVWDFNENQGNGTYRSLAIARPGQDGSIGLPPGYPVIRMQPANVTGTVVNFGKHITGMDATNLYVAFAVASGTSGLRLAELPLASFTDVSAFTDEGVLDFAASAVTPITLSGFGFVTNTASGNTAHYWGSTLGIAKEGTGYLVVFQDGLGKLYIGRHNSTGTRTNVLTITSVPTATVSGRLGVAIVGGFAYVAAAGSSADTMNQKIYKIDLTSFTVSATLPIEGAPSVTLTGGITAIGSDLYVQTSEGIHRYQTSDGAFVDNYGRPYQPAFSEQGQTPWSTNTSPNQYGLQASSGRDPLWLYRGHQSASTNSSMFSGFYSGDDILTGTPVLFGDGSKLWVMTGNFGDSNAIGPASLAANQTVQPLAGGNAFSRSVLEAEVTKSTSSTMKWTYELTLPASWRANPTHVAPPDPA